MRRVQLSGLTDLHQHLLYYKEEKNEPITNLGFQMYEIKHTEYSNS